MTTMTSSLDNAVRVTRFGFNGDHWLCRVLIRFNGKCAQMPIVRPERKGGLSPRITTAELVDEVRRCPVAEKQLQDMLDFAVSRLLSGEFYQDHRIPHEDLVTMMTTHGVPKELVDNYVEANRDS
jgi:hypothetical protein